MDKIVNSVANKIIDYFIFNGYIQADKKSVYLYSATITIQSAINICATLIIGLLFGMFFENVCFFIVFKILRKYSGGLHSSKYSICLLISIMSNTIIMMIIQYIKTNPNYIAIFLLELFSLLIVLIFSPVTNNNKNISKKEFKLYKWIASTIILVLILFSIFFIVNNCLIVIPIGMAIIFNSLLLISQKLQNFLMK